MDKKIITWIINGVLFSNIFAQTWMQVGSDIDGEATHDNSGVSVSLSSDGKMVAIGAYFNSGAGMDAGHVRIYSESAGVWTQVGSDIDGDASDLSGYSISLSSDGKRIAIRAIRANIIRVYEFLSSGGYWFQVGSDITTRAAGGIPGPTVSLSSNGKTVAFGEPYRDYVDPPYDRINTGRVKVFSESAGVWTQIGSSIFGKSEYEYSGCSVSLSSDGTRVAIGAMGYSDIEDWDINKTDGRARVYSETGGVWTQIGSDIVGESLGDQSGISVSLSSDGTRVAVGARSNSGTAEYAGHVRVYSESAGVWTQVGSDIDGEAAWDRSGWTVSLSSDGKRVAIGALGNSDAGLYAGHVRVYSESAGVWTQVGNDIDGEAAGDNSGASISLSSDGTRVAIGTPWNDGNGQNAGHTRIFQIISDTCINGSIIYNTATGKFNFCEDGVWIEK